jgi:hypothetical protein
MAVRYHENMEQDKTKATKWGLICGNLVGVIVGLVIVIAFGAILSVHYCNEYQSKYESSVTSNDKLIEEKKVLSQQKDALTAENNQLKQLDGIAALLALDVQAECASYLAAPTTYTDARIKTIISFYGSEFVVKAGLSLAAAVNFELKYHSPIYFVKANKLNKIHVVANAITVTEETGTVSTLSANEIVAIAKYNALTQAPLSIADGRLTKITDADLLALIAAHE